jgi:hypothetical protein
MPEVSVVKSFPGGLPVLNGFKALGFTGTSPVVQPVIPVESAADHSNCAGSSRGMTLGRRRWYIIFGGKRSAIPTAETRAKIREPVCSVP